MSNATESVRTLSWPRPVHPLGQFGRQIGEGHPLGAFAEAVQRARDRRLAVRGPDLRRPAAIATLAGLERKNLQKRSQRVVRHVTDEGETRGCPDRAEARRPRRSPTARDRPTPLL
jgi:hypothetical protein